MENESLNCHCCGHSIPDTDLHGIAFKEVSDWKVKRFAYCQWCWIWTFGRVLEVKENGCAGPDLHRPFSTL